jgi:hypothetical protein
MPAVAQPRTASPGRPMPLPPGPPPPAWTPAPAARAAPPPPSRAIQRAHALDLNTTARQKLYTNENDLKSTKKIKSCQEIQVLYLNGCRFVSGNTKLDNEAIENATGWSQIGIATAALKAKSGVHDIFILKNAGLPGDEVHAEQNLINIVSYMIAEYGPESIVEPIEVWGTKPPCTNVCKIVLSNYADALAENYGILLFFQGRTFGRLAANPSRIKTPLWPMDLNAAEQLATQTTLALKPHLHPQRHSEASDALDFNDPRVGDLKNSYKFYQSYNVLPVEEEKKPEKKELSLVTTTTVPLKISTQPTSSLSSVFQAPTPPFKTSSSGGVVVTARRRAQCDQVWHLVLFLLILLMLPRPVLAPSFGRPGDF